MPKDIQDFMTSQAEDIATKLLQRQQGKMLQTKPSLQVSSPKPKGMDEFLNLDTGSMAEKIVSKYDLKTKTGDIPLHPAIQDAVIQADREKQIEEAKPKGIEIERGPSPMPSGPAGFPQSRFIPPAPEPVVSPAPKMETQFGLPVATIGPTTPPPPETPEEIASGRRAAYDFLSKKDVTPSPIQKLFDVPAQFATGAINMALAGIPAVANKVMFHEDLPTPLTAAGGVAQGLGDLVGLIGPGKVLGGVTNVAEKVIGRSFLPQQGLDFMRAAAETAGGIASPAGVLNAVGEWGTRWLPKTVFGQMAKNLVTNSISMAGIYAMGENQGNDLGEIMLNKLKSMPKGAVAGAIFGTTSLARFSKLNPYTGWAIRAGAASVALDLLHGNSPWDERQLWEKVYGYGLNAMFTQKAMSPHDIKVALRMVKSEAGRIDREMRADGLNPAAAEALDNILRQIAPEMGQPVPPPRGTPQLTFMQNMQKFSGEQMKAKAEAQKNFVAKLDSAKEVIKPKDGSPSTPLSVGDSVGVGETLLRINDALSEPGKLDSAKRAELQDLLWQSYETLRGQQEAERAGLEVVVNPETPDAAPVPGNRRILGRIPETRRIRQGAQG